MRRLYLLPLLLLPSLLVAEEALPVVLPDGAPWWAGLVTMIVAMVIVPFVTNYLKKSADVKKEQLQNEQLSRRERIFLSLQGYALERAAAYAERDILTLSQMIVSGNIKDREAVKTYLRGLGTKLKADLVLYAKDNFSIDLLREFGDKYVTELIEWAANKVSPFPGQETATVLLKGGASKLLEYGLHKAQEHLKDEPANE